MKVRYIGNPNPADEQKVCTMFGRDFFLGIETDVSDLAEPLRRKLAGNGHFEVTEGERRRPGRPRKEVSEHGEVEISDEPSSP